MISRNNATVSIKIFSIVCFSFILGCFTLGCVGYILLKKTKKQNKIHFTNHRHSLEAHADIFTIDVNDAQSQTTIIIDPENLHISDKLPSPNEPIEESLSAIQQDSNVKISQLSSTEHIEKTS